MPRQLPGKVSILISSSSVLAPERPIGPCFWPHFDLIYVHTGKIVFTVMGRRQRPITADQCILFLPHTPFVGQMVGGPARVSVHHFALPAATVGLEEPFSSLSGRSGGCVLFRQKLADSIPADLARLAGLKGREDSPLIVAMRIALLTLALAALHIGPSRKRRDQRHGDGLDQLIIWLSQHLGRQIPLAQMAARMGLSSSQFRTRFTVYTSMSPGRFLQRLRLMEASRLLRESDRAIKLISQQVGYTDVGNFHRAFTAFCCFTPRGYRRRYERL